MTLDLPLPRFVVFQSRRPNNNYLTYAAEQGGLSGVVSLAGDDATSPKSKFEVERPRNKVAEVDKPVVHIRSCYNNKYLRTKNHRWIVATADDPNEDQCRWSCTLFEPVFSPQEDGPKAVRLLHVQSRLYLHWDDIDGCVLVDASSKGDGEDKSGLLFEIIDWEMMVIMPRHVAFRGDNKLFLGISKVEGFNDPCLRFGVSDERDDRSVRSQIVSGPDGRTIRIKNAHNGSFWKRDDCNWICPAGKTEDDSLDTVFQVIKIKEDTIALLNLGNNHFCKRYTVGKATSCLRAMDPTVTEFAHLEVTELVASRSIYNINFRLDHARILHYDELQDSSPRIMATAVAINNTAKPKTKIMKLTFDDSRSSTWKNSSSLKLAVSPKVRIESDVAHIRDSEIEVMASELGTSYVWDETTTRTLNVTRVHKVVMPPMTKVTVRLLATVGTCEVPFSYVQHDVLYSSEEETHVRDDGIYRGTNTCNFTYETVEDLLDSSLSM